MLDHKLTRRDSLKAIGGLATVLVGGKYATGGFISGNSYIPALISDGCSRTLITPKLVESWSILLYTNIRSKARIERGHNKKQVIHSFRNSYFYTDLSVYRTKHIGIYGWVEIDNRTIGTRETYVIPNMPLKNSPKTVQKLHNDHMHPLAIQITEHIRANSAELYELNWLNYMESSERYLKDYYANLG